jgi:hypothetical protein
MITKKTPPKPPELTRHSKPNGTSSILLKTKEGVQ